MSDFNIQLDDKAQEVIGDVANKEHKLAKIVEALPTTDIDTNTIYMVLDQSASQPGNVYNEYLYINNAWELIGTTEVAETVIANPTLVGTEANLTGLQVGDTKYAVLQGGSGEKHLYQYQISFNDDMSDLVTIEIFSSNDYIEIDFNTLALELVENFYYYIYGGYTQIYDLNNTTLPYSFSISGASTLTASNTSNFSFIRKQIF